MANVAVVIPTRNRLEYLKIAVASCFAGNDNIDVQVVIVDDGSTDETRHWLTTIDDPRIVFIMQTQAGAAKSRNVGLKRASSSYIKFLDDDDLLAPGALTCQFASMQAEERRGGAVSVFGDVATLIGHQTFLRRYGPISEELLQRTIDLLLRGPITIAPLHQRESLTAIGGFDETLERAQDYDLHLRLGLKGVRFAYVPGLVGFYRDHTQTRVSQLSTTESFLKNAEKRTELRESLLSEVFGKPLPKELGQVIARQFWWVGRQAHRGGRKDLARSLFARARHVSSRSYKWGGPGYRWLSILCGPFWADDIILNAKSLVGLVKKSGVSGG